MELSLSVCKWSFPRHTHIIIVTLASGIPNTLVHSHSSSILLLSPPASILVNINRHSVCVMFSLVYSCQLIRIVARDPGRQRPASDMYPWISTAGRSRWLWNGLASIPVVRRTSPHRLDEQWPEEVCQVDPVIARQYGPPASELCKGRHRHKDMPTGRSTAAMKSRGCNNTTSRLLRWAADWSTAARTPGRPSSQGWYPRAQHECRSWAIAVPSYRELSLTSENVANVTFSSRQSSLRSSRIWG